MFVISMYQKKGKKERVEDIRRQNRDCSCSLVEVRISEKEFPFPLFIFLLTGIVFVFVFCLYVFFKKKTILLCVVTLLAVLQCMVCSTPTIAHST